MSDTSGADASPPITKPKLAESAPATTPAGGITRATVIWIGVAVVVLSFLASFLGASLARSTESAAPVETATAQPTETPPSAEDYEAALEEILPAGSAVRAGTGVPEAGKGYEGDVYIDIATSDVYLFQDGAWVQVGNIRTSAAENLTGETGAAGDTGETGASGATGAAGAAGTQLSLGVGAPPEKTCEADGDIYIDTELLTFYECDAGTWTLFGPTASTLPAPVPTETLDSNG